MTSFQRSNYKPDSKQVEILIEIYLVNVSVTLNFRFYIEIPWILQYSSLQCNWRLQALGDCFFFFTQFVSKPVSPSFVAQAL
jgi:hypothetical protein